jgi:hypothetical protein
LVGVPHALTEFVARGLQCRVPRWRRLSIHAEVAASG